MKQLCWLAFILCSLSSPALADVFKAAHIELELVSELDQFHAGDNQLGIRVKLDPGWHIYWRYPGDSGRRPRISLSEPTNASISDFKFPIPTQIPLGPLMNYGYRGEVLLPFNINFSKPQTSPTKVSVGVDWLVCQENCIPGKAILSLLLPIGENPSPSGASQLFTQTAERLPKISDNLTVSVSGDDAEFILHVSGRPISEFNGRISFIPDQGGWIDASAAQTAEIKDGTLTIRTARAKNPSPIPNKVSGLIVSGDTAFELSTAAAAAPVPAVASIEIESPIGNSTSMPNKSSLAGALLLAFLGGVVLNLMPCVFPILGIKILGFAQNAGRSGTNAATLGFAFAGGVLLSFWVLAGMLFLLRAAGAGLGWGFQLQSPVFVSVLALLTFAIGLNFAGVFEVGSKFQTIGGELDRAEGVAGSFWSGVLATVLATPCTAPFMGTALAYSLSAPPLSSFLVFTSLGIGMALPYVALSVWPTLLKKLPRPGAWMVSLKQFLSFPMFATALWLAWVLGLQTGLSTVFSLLTGFIVLALGLWLFEIARSRLTRLIAAPIIIILAVAIPLRAISVTNGPPELHNLPSNDDLIWETYSPERLAELRSAGKPVFLDFTAAWCITCQVNKLLVFNSSEVLNTFHQKKITLLKADWTNEDDQITAALQSYGRSGVPLNVYYPPGKNSEAIILPTVLTPGAVIDIIK